MITRRTLLVSALPLAASAAGLTGCAKKKTAAGDAGPVQIRYGDDESQIAELHLPPGDAKVPVAVIIHGGFWMSSYGMELATPLAEDLARNGVGGLAIEYRRVRNGGGWPATFEDVAAAIDSLAAQPRVDLAKVVAIGHSAGGQLAVWAAGRPGLPVGAPGAGPRVVLAGAVSQAGVLDLVNAAEEQVGGDAVQQFLGTTPAKDPARYRLASPYEQIPLKVRVALIHGTEDAQVPLNQSRRYATAASRAGAAVDLTELPDIGHFELIDPHHQAWQTTRAKTHHLLTP